MSDLVVPLFIWNGPPGHTITCTKLTRDKQTIITGSETGQTCLWKLNSNAEAENERLIPHMILIGDSSPIKAIELATYDWVDALVTVTSEGVIRVWDCSDGLCLASASCLGYCPTAVVALPDQRHIACCGHSSNIDVVDVWSLEVVFSVSGHDDWVCDVHTCDLGGSEFHPFLVSMSSDGLVLFTSLLSQNIANKELPMQTLSLQQNIKGRPCSVEVAPDAKTILVVCTHVWLVYTADNCTLLHAEAKPRGLHWAGGTYASNVQILTWTKEGICYLYGLPQSFTSHASLSFPVHQPRSSSPISRAPTSFFSDPKSKISRLLGRRASQQDTKAHPETSEELASTPRAPSDPTGFKRSWQLRISGDGELSLSSTSLDGHDSSSSTTTTTTMADHSPEENGKHKEAMEDDEVHSPREPPTPWLRCVFFPGSTTGHPCVYCSKGFLVLAGGSGPEGLVRVHRIPQSLRVSEGFPLEEALQSTDTRAIPDAATPHRHDRRRLEGKGAQPSDAPPQAMHPWKRGGAVELRPGASSVASEHGDGGGRDKDVQRYFEQQQQRTRSKASSSSSSSSSSAPIIDGTPCGGVESRAASAYTDVEARVVRHHACWASARLEACGRCPSQPEWTKEAPCAAVVAPGRLAVARGYPSGRLEVFPLMADGGASDAEPLSSSSPSSSRDGDGDEAAGEAMDSTRRHGSAPSPWRGAADPHAHQGPITALAAAYTAPRGRSARKECIVSGGADGAVRVWDAHSLEMVAHSAPWGGGRVLHIVSPVTRHVSGVGWAVAAAWDHVVFSVHEGGMVAMHGGACGLIRTYSGHVGRVDRLGWDLAQGYLFVRTDAGRLSVWEQRTGRLESCVRVPHALESRTLPLSRVAALPRGAFEPVSAATLPMGAGQPPALVVRLDVLALVRAMQTNIRDGRLRPLAGLLVPWGLECGEDAPARAMGLAPPTHPIAVGVGSGPASILIPPNDEAEVSKHGDEEPSSSSSPSSSSVSHSVARQRYVTSGYVTGVHTLCALVAASCLVGVSPSEARDGASLVPFLCTLLPEALGDAYAEPSLTFLARYWQHPCVPAQQASRAALRAVLARLPAHRLETFAHSWAAKLRALPRGKSRAPAVLLLGIITTNRPSVVDPTVVREVAGELLELLVSTRARAEHRVASAELIAQGFSTWHPHYAGDVRRVVKALYATSLEMPESATLRHALMLIGSQDPRRFVEAMGELLFVRHPAPSPAARSPASPTGPNGPSSPSPSPSPGGDGGGGEVGRPLVVLGVLAKKHSVAALPHVPSIVETLVRSLDPNAPSTRRSCLRAATEVLHSLVKRFPTLDFHQSSQKLAVATEESIVVYDLKTATRWNVLQGHQHTVDALSFNAKGDVLVSYSSAGARLLFWSLSTSFLSFFGGSSSRLLSSHPVTSSERSLSDRVRLEGITLEWTSPSMVQLYRAWEKSMTTYKL